MFFLLVGFCSRKHVFLIFLTMSSLPHPSPHLLCFLLKWVWSFPIVWVKLAACYKKMLNGAPINCNWTWLVITELGDVLGSRWHFTKPRKKANVGFPASHPSHYHLSISHFFFWISSSEESRNSFWKFLILNFFPQKTRFIHKVCVLSAISCHLI